MTDERLELMSLLVQVVSGLAERTSAELERHGLTSVDLDVLVRLADTVDRPTMTDVACRTGLTPSGTTRVVDRLVDRGLVTRTPSAVDRRVTHVALTRAGRSLLEDALPDHLAVLESCLTSPLRGIGSLEGFVEQLQHLRDALTGAVPAVA